MPYENVVGHLKGTGGQLDFEWEIADFLSLSADVDDCYTSPMFFFCDSSWYLQVCPNGQKWNSSEGYIGIYLYRGDSGPPVSVTFSLFIKKKDGKKQVLLKCKHTFDKKDDNWGSRESIRRSEVIKKESEFLLSGVFTVMCTLEFEEMSVVRGDEVVRRAMKDCITRQHVSTETVVGDEVVRRAMKDCITTDHASTETDVGIVKLFSDLEVLLTNGDESDLTVEVGGEEFRLHRAIMAARSPVFSSMLGHDMREKATGVISLDDCEADPFRAFVHYLYTGCTDRLSPENMHGVYRMADKYHVDDLKKSCMDCMKHMLSVDTFCDTLSLALQYDETELISRATDFLSENSSDIMSRKDWRNLLRNNPAEISEILMNFKPIVKTK